MLLDHLDLREHLDPIAKKDRRLELPVRNTDQGQRRNIGLVAAQPGKNAQAKQAMGDRFAERRGVCGFSVKRVVITGQRGEISDVVRRDLSPLAVPVVPYLHVFQVQQFGVG